MTPAPTRVKSLAAQRAPQIRRALAAWFRRNARKLPWRTTPRDPWAVWVSEIMLQQTRVTAVAPYFESFLQRFPDVRSLADSELDEVLARWSGLGYYRRARALHAGAREVVERFGGKVPDTLEQLRSLPGVGEYTAAAIASLAFGVPAAVVDGNVRRVVARLFALRSADAALHRELARTLLSPRAPAVHNEAMMELGALVCTPGEPHCASCAVAAWCDARASGLQAEIPAAAVRPDSPVVPLVAVVLTRGDELLLGRRKRDGLFGGLWDPPTLARPLSAQWKRSLRRQVGAPLPRPVATLRHVLTHRVLEVDVVCVALRVRNARADAALEVPPGYEQLRWVTREQARALGSSTLSVRVLSACGL
jgi:A/G-specific adenine glycosylase